MAKEKMSQTQTSTKYAEPPIKINRALYGVLLASLASVFWGSMGVCVQYIVNFQRFPTLDAKKLVNAPKMSAHHRGICHF